LKEDKSAVGLAVIALALALTSITSAVVGNYLDKNKDNYVQRLIAGDNIVLNPENGLGIVTITSTGVGGRGYDNDENYLNKYTDNYVQRLIAGPNITLNPENGLGIVTVSATGTLSVPENNVTRIIAGTRIVISPENGYGNVTISVNDNALIWLENHENRIKKIEDNTYVNWLIAGDRINLSDNKGTVTISVKDNALVWLENLDNRVSIIEGNYLNKHTDNYVQRLIAGENIVLDPENGLGIVTVTSHVLNNSIIPDMLTFGTWELISDLLVGTDTTSVTFTGLDLTAAKAYLLFINIRNPTTANSDYQFIVNQDTTLGNYYRTWHGITFQGVYHVYGGANNNYLFDIWNGRSGFHEVLISRGLDGLTRFSSIGVRYAGGEFQSITHSMVYNVNTNMTRLDITAVVANAIGAGSRFMLFRVSK
jgi:hypothetical protein